MRLLPGILALSLAFVLVETGPADAAPSVSGGRILVLDDSPGGQGVVSVRARGGDVRSLDLNLPAYAYPDFSPDGKRVAYTDGWSVYTAKADGTDRQWLIDGASVPSHPRWKPDGREIGYEAGDITAATTGELSWRQVYSSELGGELTFDWSPDGRFIAVVVSWAVGGEPWDPVYARDIWIVQADGSMSARRLTTLEDGWSPYRIAWSPDGRTLVTESQGDLWSVAVRNGALTNLTATPAITESSPIWSPDGRTLAYGRQPADAAAPRVHLRPANARGDAGRALNITGIPTSWR